MVFGQGIGAEEAVMLNRLRRRTERWTDVLLARVMLDHDIGELAFDRSRAKQFAADFRHEQRSRTNQYAWPLVLSSLRSAFQTGNSSETANGDLNREIAGGVLACFGPELFDSTGLMKSIWQVRLSNVTNDAQGLLDELLSSDVAVTPTGDRFGRRDANHSHGPTRRF